MLFSNVEVVFVSLYAARAGDYHVSFTKKVTKKEYAPHNRRFSSLIMDTRRIELRTSRMLSGRSTTELSAQLYLMIPVSTLNYIYLVNFYVFDFLIFEIETSTRFCYNFYVYFFFN